MALTTYAQLAEVRAALGVNDVELKDAVLNLPVYEMGLTRELNKVSTSLPAAFSTVAGIDENSRTDAQQLLYRAVREFSVYVVAKQVGVSLASFAPKDVQDGKASISRFAGESFKKTQEELDGICSVTRASLVAAWAEFNSSGSSVDFTPGTFFVAAARGVDPVTGE